MASFVPIPDVPMEGLNAAESGLFRAIKEDVELLCGLNAQASFKAITTDKVLVAAQANPQLVALKAGANGYATVYGNGAALAAVGTPIGIVNYQDYANLVQDVQQLQNAVTYLTGVVNSLITQLRS